MKLYHLDREATRNHSRNLLLAIVDPIDGGRCLNSATKLAEIDSDDKNYAYRHTQNIDDTCAEHAADGVQVIANGPVRSTHSGDILEDDGIYSAVAARMGFTTLSWFAPPASNPSASPAP